MDVYRRVIEHRRVWAMAYAATLVVFAFLYLWIPGAGFYQSSVAADSAVVALADSVAIGLHREVAERIAATAGSDTLTDGAWRLTPRTGIILSRPRVEAGDWIDFEMTLVARLVDADGEVTGSAIGFGVARIPAYLKLKPAGRPGRTKVYMKFEQSNAFPFSLRRLFPFEGAEEWPDDFAVVEMSDELHADLTRFLEARKGDPRAGPGGFARMFYLSVVTITTLGYGDIVPTNTLARWLIAAEAMLGVFCIGLFLASLAGQRRPHI